MQEITVKIKWNEPDEPFWLNADNVKLALSTYCQNTTFEVEASRDSRTLSAVPSEEEIYIEARIFENYKSEKFGTPEGYESSGRFYGFVKGAEWAIQKLTKRGIAG